MNKPQKHFETFVSKGPNQTGLKGLVVGQKLTFRLIDAADY